MKNRIKWSYCSEGLVCSVDSEPINTPIGEEEVANDAPIYILYIGDKNYVSTPNFRAGFMKQMTPELWENIMCIANGLYDRGYDDGCIDIAV